MKLDQTAARRRRSHLNPDPAIAILNELDFKKTSKMLVLTHWLRQRTPKMYDNNCGKRYMLNQL
ncbi:hypothetical protein [Oscillatoria sp. HE19RPO]|uniref:hypothetical protein n=1 Tax=Oscillatoria sp. HE19RPO TaxID=2954806 RepID=UPI0020C3FE1F|nr:hypothetical protein [Oscillatoria sp. HE19RPO]